MNKVPTSSQFVRFVDTRNYFVQQGAMKILVEYYVDPQVLVTCEDWIALFPKNFDLESPINTRQLNEMITYEFVLQPPVDEQKNKYNMVFSLSGSKNLQFDQEYKFVYCNSDSEILGMSQPFRFSLNRKHHQVDNQDNKQKQREPYRSVNRRDMCHKGRPSWEFASGKENTAEVQSVDQSAEIHHSTPTRNRWKQNTWQHKEQNFSKQNRPVLSPGFQANNSCKNCQRVSSLLTTQNELYMQVKNLAEEKMDLVESVRCLEKQIELSQAAYQNQMVKLMHEREARINYQNEVSMLKKFIQEECVLEAPRTPNPETGRNQGESPRTSNMTRLKAIIGNQEENLRILNERLIDEQKKVESLMLTIEELQKGDICKVNVVETEIEESAMKLECLQLQYNNNEGEASSDTD